MRREATFDVEGLAPRVGQACVACRRKKIKCDGHSPCHNCSSRDTPCEYAASQDNAATSRTLVVTIDERCRQLDSFCHRLEALAGQLTRAVEDLQRTNHSNAWSNNAAAAAAGYGAPSLGTDHELVQAGQALQCLMQPGQGPTVTPLPATQTSPADAHRIPSHIRPAPNPQPSGDNDHPVNEHMNDDHDHDDDDDDDEGNSNSPRSHHRRRRRRRHRQRDEDSDSESDDDNDDDSNFESRLGPDNADGRFGTLVTDSYGNPRFVGGAANSMLIEAVQSLTPGHQSAASSGASPVFTTGSSTDFAATTSGVGAQHSQHGQRIVHRHPHHAQGFGGPNVPVGNASATPVMGAAAGGGGGALKSAEGLEIPFFVHGSKWRDLPFLPRPGQLSRPPRYVADLLVSLYFDQLHYTFPVLYKPAFMDMYHRHILNGGGGGGGNSGGAGGALGGRGGGRGDAAAAAADEGQPDKRFLSVFYAVCACASSLLPTEMGGGGGGGGKGGGGGTKFPGLDYYEKALLLHFSSTGEACLERVQCLALLAVCCAGWNTLSQSWNLAAQAVHAAQEMGLHLTNLIPMPDVVAGNPTSGPLRREISKRVWWSIYCLDRMTSICLGRPMAAHDGDWHCALPVSAADEDLEETLRRMQKQQEQPHVNPKVDSSASESDGSAMPTTSPMLGFVAFARLCHISGKVQDLHTPSRQRRLTASATGSGHKNTGSGSKKARSLLKAVGNLDRSLDAWLAGLPNDIRFSANVLDRGPNLTMCVIMFIVHAGSLLNLYRSLPSDVSLAAPDMDPVQQCISAARSCINAAELVRELVPPSHHLAFSVHYLTLSGLYLAKLRTEQRFAMQFADDINKCVHLLTELELTWSGAAKGRAIIEHLLRDPAGTPGSGLQVPPFLMDWHDPDVFGGSLYTFGSDFVWGST